MYDVFILLKANIKKVMICILQLIFLNSKPEKCGHAKC